MYTILSTASWWRFSALALLAVVVVPQRSTVHAGFSFTPFGPHGEGGTINGQILYFGSGGEIYELDAFFAVAGADLNGAALGTAAQLSHQPLPEGLNFSFDTSVSDDGSDLALTYRFTNNSAATLGGTWFGFFVDPQIDEPVNGYTNEYGALLGAPGAGESDLDPDQWEIDEPGYVFGDMFVHLLNGWLDQGNGIPFETPDDASLALGFFLGVIDPQNVAVVNILLSDDADRIGSLALVHADSNPESFDALYLSGSATVAAVPEPDGWLLALFSAASAVLLRVPSKTSGRSRQPR